LTGGWVHVDVREHEFALGCGGDSLR
jgi:hypothetical protein